MSVTRYYVGPQASATDLALAWQGGWSVVPTGTNDTNARRRAYTTRPVESVAPYAAAKPGTLPGTTAAVHLAFPPLTAARRLEGTFRAVLPVSFIGASAIRGRWYVATATGAVRGFLADVTMPDHPSSAANVTRLFSGALAAVEAQAGDRIVLELGFRIASGLGGSAGITFHGASPTADYPYTAGIAASNTTAPWIEVDLLDPPETPRNLRQVSATPTYVEVDWDAPAGGPAPTGYEFRLDGGAIEALDASIGDPGAGATVGLYDLAPGTTYLVEVRTTTANGPSAWVALEAATEALPDVTGLRLEVGPEGAAIDLLGDAYSITIKRGNSSRGVTDTLEPATLVAVIDGPQANPLTVTQVRTGAPVRVLVGLGPVWETLYTGRIDRARLAYDAGKAKADPAAYRVTLTATDPATPVLAAHPHDTAIAGALAQRVAHVLDATGLAYSVDDPAPATAAPALATGEKTAGGNLRLAVDTAHAIAYVDRYGVLRVTSDHARPRTADAAAADYLATDDPGAPATAIHYYDVTPSLDTDALVNVLDVDLDGTTTTHVDADSLDEWGPHADAVKVNDGLPETHADLWLASRRDPALRPEALAFNVGNPHRPLRPGHLAAAARLEVYDTLDVVREGVFDAPAKMAVRDITHTITASARDEIRWLCLLGLRPLEVLATRWDDVPPTLRWDDVPPGMTWDDAVRWHPYL